MINTMKRLFSYIKPYRLFFLLAIGLTCVYVIAAASLPYIAGLVTTKITQNVLHHESIDFHYIAQILTLLIGVGLLNAVAQYLGNYFMTKVAQKSMYDLRQDIAHKLNRLPVSYFDHHQQGDLLSRVTNDVDALSNAFQQSFISVISSVLTLLAAIVMMFSINWKLAIIALLIIPIALFGSKKMIVFSQPYFQGQQNALGAMNAFVQEKMTGFNVIKLYGREEQSKRDFKKVNDELMKQAFRANTISGLMMPLMNLIAYSAYIVVVVYGGFICLAGQMAVGQLQAFVQYVWQISQPVAQLTQLASVIQSASASTKRIFALLDEPEEEQTVVTQQLPKVVHGDVTFEHVAFSYVPEVPLIKDLSFKARAGETVAIVGPTGAGKTTLVNLLMRFYDIQKGKITLDGIDTATVARNDLRQQFGMVLQDSWLYNGTIMDNIRFGKLAATDQEVIEAAKAANIHDYIMSLPDGYETKIATDNQHLSQGQIQLLTIARAVLANPRILILDEATSSVDTRLEEQIQEAMDRLMSQRTSFVIAHRLSTIRDASLILVMNHGSIIEQGTHQSLLNQNGFYAQLYRSQFDEQTKELNEVNEYEQKEGTEC